MSHRNVAIRADASTATGSGHVVRCLTLADELRRGGFDCYFVTRSQPGALAELIGRRGHAVRLLPAPQDARQPTWEEDAQQTQSALADLPLEWLIVDHYELGLEWETALAARAERLMALDDLGRAHRCDLLLDQNLRSPLHVRYRQTGSCATLLLGPEYALVRPEFASRRAAALALPREAMSRVLVSMGGTDPANDTSTVLRGLMDRIIGGLRVDVVIGAGNPHRREVTELCARSPHVELHIQTQRMAELMTQAHVAMTGAGGTTWERCVLGLPSLITIQSADQTAIAEAMASAGADVLLGRSGEIEASDYGRALERLTPERLRAMSRAISGICDGHGAERVALKLLHR